MIFYSERPWILDLTKETVTDYWSKVRRFCLIVIQLVMWQRCVSYVYKASQATASEVIIIIMREPVKLHISLSILHGLEWLDYLFIYLPTKVFVKVVYYACVVLTTLLTSMEPRSILIPVMTLSWRHRPFSLCLKLRNPSTKDKTRFEEFPRIGSDYCIN